jgi:hypothetical protein
MIVSDNDTGLTSVLAWQQHERIFCAARNKVMPPSACAQAYVAFP